jgi:2-amino-4-ketopentanoate thiolase alpha subunit
MVDTEMCATGDWIEVQCTFIEAADRSEGLPPETADKALLEWVKGFAQAEAVLGRRVTVRTMTGRLVTGRLSCVNPGYFHTFGQPIPELRNVGIDLRTRLDESRKAGA